MGQPQAVPWSQLGYEGSVFSAYQYIVVLSNMSLVSCPRQFCFTHLLISELLAPLRLILWLMYYSHPWKFHFSSDHRIQIFFLEWHRALPRVPEFGNGDAIILRLGCLECTQYGNTVCDVLKFLLKKLIMNLNMCHDSKIKFPLNTVTYFLTWK